jgi:hypothetical protein
MPPALTVLRSFCWRHGVLLARSPHVAEHLSALEDHIGVCPYCFIRECESTIYYLRFKTSSGSLKVLPMASQYVLANNMTDFPLWMRDAIDLYHVKVKEKGEDNVN